MTNTIKTRVLESGTTVVEISGRLNLGNALSSTEASIKRLISEGSRKVGDRSGRPRFHRQRRYWHADQLQRRNGSGWRSRPHCGAHGESRKPSKSSTWAASSRLTQTSKPPAEICPKVEAGFIPHAPYTLAGHGPAHNFRRVTARCVARAMPGESLQPRLDHTSEESRGRSPRRAGCPPTPRQSRDDRPPMFARFASAKEDARRGIERTNQRPT